MIAKTIAQIFLGIAKILEIKGGNVFRIRAYERAAGNVESLSEDIQDLINDGRLSDIPGIGADLAEKIKEIVKTGKLEFFESLKKTIPEGLLELLSIPSVGPKTARLFYEKLKIKSVPELERAAKDGSLLKLEGVKEKTAENILRGIALLRKGRERMDLASAASCANELMRGLKEKARSIRRISACGSLRRMKETVRDIDILAVSDSPEEVMNAFTGLPQVKDIIAKGAAKSSIITRENTQVDLRAVEAKSFGAALLYFTGSKDFNIKIRQIAVKKGLKVNEYGVFVMKKGKETYLCGKAEEEVFNILGLAYIAPELRENTGEIELAAKNRLPDLINLEDVKGDLHAHSNYSDGNNGILEMARAAQKLGYEYLNMSDHSQGLKVAGGLSARDLKKKRAEVDSLNSKLKNFKILFGSEVDIDSEGKLDYPDKILNEFDCVVAAIHSGFKQSKSQLTNRLVNACKNKNVDILAHPTGRLWGRRDGYEIDFDEVFKAARDYGVAVEINAFPLRLDLNGVQSRRAKELGLKIAVSTDSHAAGQLQYMRLGVATARRGWLSKEDAINTLSYDELMRVFKK